MTVDSFNVPIDLHGQVGPHYGRWPWLGPRFCASARRDRAAIVTVGLLGGAGCQTGARVPDPAAGRPQAGVSVAMHPLASA